MDFGDIFAPLLGFLGAEQKGKWQESLQNQANAFSAQQFATRYQTSVKDLEAAGLNPMLAYSNGPGSSPSGAMGQAPDPGGGATAAYSAYQQAEVAKAQKELLQAQTKKTEAETLTENQRPALVGAQGWHTQTSAELNRWQVNLVQNQAEKLRLELANVPKEGNRIDAVTRNLYESVVLMQQQGMTQEATAKNLEALTKKALAEGGLSQLDLDAALKFENLGRMYKELAPFIRFLRSVIMR